MSLRSRILLFLFIFALLPLLMAVVINLPLVLERIDSFYRQAFLQNLRADFSDLDEHLANRKASATLLAKLPEPSLLLTESGRSEVLIELDRARYTEWINRILLAERDIVEIRFLDRDGVERFWLGRDSQTRSWFAKVEPLPPLSEPLLKSIREGAIADVQFSSLRVNPDAQDAEHVLNLQLAAPVNVEGQNTGAVVITVDISALVRRDLNTHWVLDDGSYLQLPDLPRRDTSAFADFEGLAEDFAARQLLLWESDGRRWIWVPMFVTENGNPIWVGREVDSDPLRSFRAEIVQRVLAIVAGLVVLLLFSARLLAKRAETISSDLIGGIRKTLQSDSAVRFDWSDMPELQQLSADLTQLSARHAEQVRKQAQHTRELERSNQYKSEFLANVSHELRTPLNSILLLSKLLGEQEAGLREEQRQQAAVINKAGQDLKSLIDNILDLSKIEAQRLEVACESIEVADLVETVRALMQPQFDEKSLAFSVQFAAEAPRQIRSDPDKIRQILLNFVANALKFTAQGGVQLLVRAGSDKLPLELVVVDSGIGIPEEKQAHIFEAFSQADGSTSRRFGGTGLGLTISRQLAHLLGGDIRLQSRAGEGASFALCLPLSCDAASAQPAVPSPALPEIDEDEPAGAAVSLSDQHVLLMASEVKLQLKLTQWFKQAGAQVHLADDAEEACESIDEQGAMQVLVFDPRLLADATCDTIKTILSHNKTAMTLVGLHSMDSSDELVQCEAAKPNHIIALPLDLAELERVFSG